MGTVFCASFRIGLLGPGEIQGSAYPSNKQSPACDQLREQGSAFVRVAKQKKGGRFCERP